MTSKNGNSPLLQIEEMTKVYQMGDIQVHALRGVSLSVAPCEFVGIVGPNGAGKTTILTVINGLGKLVQGRVQVLGHALKPGNGHGLSG